MKQIIAVGIIVLLFAGGLFFIANPLETWDQQSFDLDTSTDRNSFGNVRGYNNELIGPKNRKGFITSYKNDGMSETVTVIGKLEGDYNGAFQTTVEKYGYYVYGKQKPGDSWELLAKPGFTKKYITSPSVMYNNNMYFTQDQDGEIVNLNDYSFEVVGSTYKALKVVLRAKVDWDVGFGEGAKWTTLQQDEAYLYEGWGSLSYPLDNDNKPQSTFEIGETAKIRVRTTYGGQVVDEGKTWRVALKAPQDQGGEEIKHVDYGDNVDTFFTFTVTPDMFDKNSDNTYQLEIYNTLLPKGTLPAKTIDLKAKAPSDVHITSDNIQYKNGENIGVTLRAGINEQTQLPLEYFQVAIFYGAGDTLLPSDPFSNRWIIPTTKVTDLIQSYSSYTYDLVFTADENGYEGFVTVIAWAYDTEGRSSIHPKRYTVYIYTEDTVPDETIDDETGEDYYYGGHTEGWMPWDPSGGNWGDIIIEEYINLVISCFVAIICLIVAILGDRLKVPFGIHGRLFIAFFGFLQLVIVYYFYYM